MNRPIYCPLCNGQMTTPTRCEVISIIDGNRDYYLGLTTSCINCAAVTEINAETGALREFPRWRLVNLFDPDNFIEMPRTWRTMCLSMLYGGRES